MQIQAEKSIKNNQENIEFSEENLAKNKDSENLSEKALKIKLSRTNKAQLVSHSLNNVINLFISTFLVSYIYSISNNYMVSVGLFYLFNYLAMGIVYLLVSAIIDRTNRVIFYRIAMVIRASFIIMIIFIGKELAGLIVLAGVLHGSAEACYWASYNVMKNELVRKSAMKKYLTHQQINDQIVNVVVPLVLGSVIDAESFKVSAIIVAGVVIIQLISSFFIKCYRPENSSFNLKGFIKDVKSLGKNKNSVTNCILIAGVYGFQTAVEPLKAILVMLVFDSNFSLGIITSIASFATILFIILINKIFRPGKNGILYTICGFLPLVAAIILSININKTTIIIYTIAYSVLHLSYTYSFDVCRNVVLKRLNMYDSIDEYQAMIEVILQLARMTMFGFIAIGGAIGIAVGGTEALVVATKILSIVSMLAVLTLNILLGLYEKKLVKHNIL